MFIGFRVPWKYTIAAIVGILILFHQYIGEGLNLLTTGHV